MTEAAGVLDVVAQKAAKRDEEQKRILQLKQRLDALKKDSANERITKEELIELHKKCESILSLTRRIADSIEEKITCDKKELSSLKQKIESSIPNVDATEIQNLKDKVGSLEKENEALQDQCKELSQNNTQEDEDWKTKYENEKKRADDIEKKLKRAKKQKRKDSLSTPQECQIENDLAEVNLFEKLNY